MSYLRIDDLKPEETKVREITVTRDLILEFGTLTGDANPLHSDDNFGRKTQFGQINAQGMLLSSLMIGLVGSSYPGPGWMCLGVDFSFNQPVFPEEKIKINIKVNQVLKALGVATLEGEVIKENGDVAGRAQVKVKELEIKA